MKTEKELRTACEKEAARLEKMGAVSKRIAAGIRAVLEEAEGVGVGILNTPYNRFLCDTAGEKLSLFQHFLRLVEGACFLYYNDDIKDVYLWHDKAKHDNDPGFYMHIEASYLARAWERIKFIESKL